MVVVVGNDSNLTTLKQPFAFLHMTLSLVVSRLYIFLYNCIHNLHAVFYLDL